MDKLFIRQLSVSTIVGVCPRERQTPQTLLLDVEYQINAQDVAISDDLKKTIDYGAVCDSIQSFLPKHQFYLLETLADRLAKFLLKQWGMQWIRLVVIKPGVLPNTQGVGIEVERAQLFP